jgi:hypothetical protein
MKKIIHDGNHKEALFREARHAVFSIATNGYEKKFAFCIRSQQDYCRRLGVPYFLLQGRPPWGIGSHDSSWLKIPTLHYLLQYFRGGVLYLDADCEVLQHSDDFRIWDRDEPGKSLFAARDFSNRINAAVIYCRGNPQGRRLMRRLAWSAFVPEILIPREDRNLYENGHFIWVCKNATQLHILPNEWNCGIYNELSNPHILHHGGTIMREARGEQPTALGTRLFAAWTGLRLPVHMAWFSKCLQIPFETGAGEY